MTQAEARRAIARELHDRVAQTLTHMVLDLESFKAEQQQNEAVFQHLGELQASTRDVLASLRRTLYDLRGQTGVEEHFADTVRELLSTFNERTHVDVVFSVAPTWPTSLRSSAALNLYRIIEEALSNVSLHSGARHVEVALAARNDDIAVEVKDDGCGAGVNDHRRPGLGLIGMRERAVILGGRLEVDSATDHGTTIRAILSKESVT